MSDALQRLIQKTRPFKTFTVDFPEGRETYKVRRTSVLENEAIAKNYTDTYDAAIKRLQDDSTADYSVLRRSLSREKPEAIAKYLVQAAHSDTVQDVLDLHDGENLTEDDEKVKAAVAAYEAKLQADLEKQSVEDLMEAALDKREHFLAIFEANRSRLRMIASLTIYDENGERMFPTADSVGELDEATVEKIIAEASKALTDEAPLDPLK